MSYACYVIHTFGMHNITTHRTNCRYGQISIAFLKQKLIICYLFFIRSEFTFTQNFPPCRRRSEKTSSAFCHPECNEGSTLFFVVRFFGRKLPQNDIFLIRNSEFGMRNLELIKLFVILSATKDLLYYFDMRFFAYRSE